jgi:hypothetical protein
MGLIETALALVGLVALIRRIIRWCTPHEPPRPLEDDPAAPYRDGLHAAIRMQTVAHDLEQKLYAEATKHVKDNHEQP